MAGIYLMQCGARLSVPQRSETMAMSPTCAAGQECVRGAGPEASRSSKTERARGPGLNEGSPQRSHNESPATVGQKDPLVVWLVSYQAR